MAEILRTLSADDDAYRIVQDIVGAVETITRWTPSRWNGVVHVAAAPSRLENARRSWNREPGRWFDADAAVANPDGSMTVREDALKWTRDAKAGKLKHKHNFKAHHAVLGMVTAAVTLSRNPDPGPGASHDEDAASEVLTVGLARDFARRHAHEIITVTGLNRNDRLLDVNPVIDPEPHATSAAATLTAGLAEPGAARMPVGEVRRQLIGVAPAERWNWMADALIKNHLNGREIAPERLEALREQVAGIAHDQYAQVAGVPAMLADMRPEPALRARHRIEQATSLGKKYAERTLVQLAVKNWGSAITMGSDHAEAKDAGPAAAQPSEPVKGFQNDGAIPPAGGAPRGGTTTSQGAADSPRHNQKPGLSR